MIKELELLLHSLPLLQSLAVEISETCSRDDKKSLEQTIQKLKNDLNELMMSLHGQSQILEGVTSEKDAMQQDVARCLDWTQETKRCFEEVQLIGLDLSEAQQAIDEHKVR